MTRYFPTTRRSIITALESGDTQERGRAMELLGALYWKPLYKYARLHFPCSREEAEDLTQSFLLRLLEAGWLARYDSAQGSFRNFIRLLFDRFAINEGRAARRLKRGGGAGHLDIDLAEQELRAEAREDDPEAYFRQQWVRSVFSAALERLSREIPEDHYALFEEYDLNDERGLSYSALAERFHIPETTVTNRLAGARRKFRQVVLDLLREITASDQEFRAEAQALLGIDP